MRMQWGKLLTIVALAAAVSAGGAQATEITSAGPLTTVGISPDLNCYVNHQLDSFPEFYGSTACGSFVATDGTLYGPDTVPAGFYPGDGMHTAWTPISQSGVSGSGTTADPFLVSTSVTGGPLAISQVDRYVLGEESFRTDTTIQNTSDAPRAVTFYRAGDCYLGNSDYGYGRVDGDAINCLAANGDGSKGTRIEQFLPVTGGSSFYHATYYEVWQRLRDQSVFDNTCRCDERIDNGAGLSWVRTLEPGASVRISSIITFSPAGTVPLVIRKAADRSEVGSGDAVGYTVTVVNSNVRDVQLTSLTDLLPAGATYLADSTTGDTTNEPVGNPDGSITWNGPFTVPAEDVFTLHYTIRVPDREGTYRNSVIGEGVDVTVVPAEDGAPIDVGPPPPTPTFDISKITDDPFDDAGSLNGYWITVSNPTGTPITLSEVIDRLPRGYVYQPRSATELTSDDPTVDGRVLTWDGPFLVPARSAVKLHFNVRTADAAGINPNFATATPAPFAGPGPGPGPVPQPVPTLTVKPALRRAIVALVRKLQPLGIRIIAPRRVRTGQPVTIRVRTGNPSRVGALRVRTCVRLPSGLSVGGRDAPTVCRITSRLPRHTFVTLTLHARAGRPALLRLGAAARGLVRSPVTTRARIRVVPLPPRVTG